MIKADRYRRIPFAKKYSTFLGQEYLMVYELEGTFLMKRKYYKLSVIHECSGLSESLQDFHSALDSALDITPHVFVLLGDTFGASYTSAVNKNTDKTV